MSTAEKQNVNIWRALIIYLFEIGGQLIAVIITVNNRLQVSKLLSQLMFPGGVKDVSIYC